MLPDANKSKRLVQMMAGIHFHGVAREAVATFSS
jgi:hypothetical protein